MSKRSSLDLQRCALFAALSVFACGEVAAPPRHEPAIAPVPGLRLERIYAVSSSRGVELGGFDGAAEAGTIEIASLAGQPIGTASVGADGRFRFRSTEASARLQIRRTGGAWTEFRVRDPEAARAAAVWPALRGLGNVPNDLLVLPSGDLVLARSGDHAVSVFNYTEGLAAGRGVRLPEIAGPSGPERANPFFLTLGADGTAYVSAFGQRHAYALDLEQTRVRTTFTIDTPVPLPERFVLPRAFDVNGDGNPENEVDRVLPRAPQALAVLGKHLYLGYTNFVSPRLGPDRPPIYLPGLIAEWDLEAPERAPRLLWLPALNPQEIRIQQDDRLLVTCSGVLDQLDETTRATTPGAVFEVDRAAFTITRAIELADFAPGSALEARGALWVGSLVRAQVLRVERADPGSRRRIGLGEDTETVDSVFRLELTPEGLLIAPVFNTDRVHLIDPKTARVDPLPFGGPLIVGPGRPFFAGVQVVAARPGARGVDFVGPDRFVLAGIASELIPIEFRKVFGP